MQTKKSFIQVNSFVKKIMYLSSQVGFSPHYIMICSIFICVSYLVVYEAVLNNTYVVQICCFYHYR